MPEQIAGVSFFVWLACVYALGLVAVGWCFDILAKRTSQRVVAARTFGFTYHEESDAWLCPEDQWLWATAFDSDNRVMRYRAKPSVCNTCPIKDSCTVSANAPARWTSGPTPSRDDSTAAWPWRSPCWALWS